MKRIVKMADKLSIIIPSRNEQFLYNTVDDLFSKAQQPIEIIVVLDGYWPNPPLQDRKNLVIIHKGVAQGMRPAINSAANVATGKYLMKCDAHCLFDEGFDVKLKQNCDKDWLSVPTRYSLDSTKWQRDKLNRPINYHYFTFPYDLQMGHAGLHAKNYGPEYNVPRKRILIDDLMTFQGSCWFMHKDYFFKLIYPMDHENYYFYQESQELGMKVWLSGGRVIINKNTWYAHLYKGRQFGRGFFLSKRRKIESEVYSANFWINDLYKGIVKGRNFKWFIDKFWPLPEWPEDWTDPKYLQQFKDEGKLF
jgi:glycosyltransferase involved in cell wall biosynthesis